MSKGRNKNLIKKRNEALIRRYYYWTEVRRRRFDDVSNPVGGGIFSVGGKNTVHNPGGRKPA